LKQWYEQNNAKLKVKIGMKIYRRKKFGGVNSASPLLTVVCALVKFVRDTRQVFVNYSYTAGIAHYR
jgi:hypothetical protein